MLKIELAFKGKILKQIETDKSEITIGRGNNNDIQIDNLGVSNAHAKIIKYPDAYTVIDLNSTNGTRINGGARITQPTPLYPGQALMLGDTIILSYEVVN